MAFELFVGANGVPYSDYGTYHGLEIGRQTSVLSVAERGLWYWDTFGFGRTPDQSLLSYDWTRYPKDRSCNPVDRHAAGEMMAHCADWLLRSLRPRGDFLVWEYPYPMSYGTRPGWCSAHAQTVGMQFLVRMRELLGDPAYTAPLPGLLRAFRVPVIDGGLLDDTDEGVIWYEKFAAPANQKPKVLNGMLFAVIGLQDIAARTGDAQAGLLARNGLDAVRTSLHRFDLGNWSAYDILGKPASLHYHAIHIRQLALLHSIYGDDRIDEYLTRFKRYLQAGKPTARPAPAAGA